MCSGIFEKNEGMVRKEGSRDCLCNRSTRRFTSPVRQNSIIVKRSMLEEGPGCNSNQLGGNPGIQGSIEGSSNQPGKKAGFTTPGIVDSPIERRQNLPSRTMAVP